MVGWTDGGRGPPQLEMRDVNDTRMEGVDETGVEMKAPDAYSTATLVEAVPDGWDRRTKQRSRQKKKKAKLHCPVVKAASGDLVEQEICKIAAGLG